MASFSTISTNLALDCKSGFGQENRHILFITIWSYSKISKHIFFSHSAKLIVHFCIISRDGDREPGTGSYRPEL